MLLDNLPHECTIRRRVITQDSMGGSLSSYVVEQTGVGCWEQQASATEIHDYQKRGMLISTKIFFVADPRVTERHEILITSRFGEAVVTPDVFDVKSDTRPDASAGLGVLWRVMCDRPTGKTQ